MLKKYSLLIGLLLLPGNAGLCRDPERNLRGQVFCRFHPP